MKKTKTTYKLLQILADGRFHSGQKLGQALSMTRSGIWKAVKQLQALNIEIHAVTGKGYRIPRKIELLEDAKILAHLNQANSNALDQLILHTTVDSTNDYLLESAKRFSNQIVATSAEHQTAGRGRSGREWTSSFASSLYQSILWHFDKDPSELVGLSLAVGVCIMRTLRQHDIQEGLQLKWPNDVLWHGRKLAGILIDMIAEPHGTCSVVIGIGLNVSLPYQLGKTINQPWVDIAEIIQRPPQRNKLAGLLLNELMNTLNIFNQQGLQPFIEQWRSYDTMTGQTISLKTQQGEVKGIMQGVSNTGELIVLTQNNELKHFLSGEVSLRLGATC